MASPGLPASPTCHFGGHPALPAPPTSPPGVQARLQPPEGAASPLPRTINTLSRKGEKRIRKSGNPQSAEKRVLEVESRDPPGCPWQGRQSCQADQPPVNGSLVKRVFLLEDSRISLAPTARSSCPHCLLKYHSGNVQNVFFLSSLQDLKPSVGLLDARVYTWLSRVASSPRTEILFPGALCRVPPGLPHPHCAHPS